MTAAVPQQDLVILTADRSTEFAITGMLGRARSLGIRQITFRCFNHPEKDPGCCLAGHDFLRPFTNHFHHALVVFDREGCGQERRGREELGAEVGERLFRSGWGERAQAVVIDPELEMWVWSDSPQVDRVLGWHERQPNLRSWLVEQGFLDRPGMKPPRPKEAFQAALRHVRKPLSPALFSALAEKVSLDRCTDPSFLKLKEILQNWFPD
jgi:hypothetical protein